MKTSLLLVVGLGLILAGCSQTDSPKSTASNQPDANQPASDGTTKQDANKSAQIAADPVPGSEAGSNHTAVAPSTPPSPSVAMNSSTPAPSFPPAADPLSSSGMGSNLAPNPASSSDVASSDAKPLDSALLTEWKLTPDQIKDEVQAGRLARTRAPRSGEPTGSIDSLAVSQITNKLQRDTTTAGLKLDVESDKGVVTLHGSATSLAQIGKATALALDTDGITQAVSLIKLQPAPMPE